MSRLPDIEQLIALAQSDPEQLERIRQQEIEALICRAPEHMRPRLRGLQFQIDCKRRLHKSSVGACLAITGMMMDSLQELNQALHHREHGEAVEEPCASASVIAFPVKSKQASLHVQ